MQSTEEVKCGGVSGMSVSLSAELSCLQGGGEGAEREAALATLEKQLICPICLELFSKPVVILPCQHNLCRKCANELYQPSLFQARTTMMLSSGRFRCPSCRHEVVLDRHGVYGLQRNLLVENIIDSYKEEVSNSKNASPLPLPPAPAQVTCQEHEGEKVNIYCITCQLPTCSLCKVFGAHQSCKVAPLTEVYQQQKDELNEEVGALVAYNGKIKSFVDELEETIKRLEENCKAQKQMVCDTFNHMMSIMEERQKAMTQQISSEQEEKTGHIQALMCRYGDSVEGNSKLMERATSSMEEPDMGAFVQKSGELITKVTAASSSCPTETLTPGYEKLKPYRFNFISQEKALQSIDFDFKVVEEPPVEPEVESQPEEHNEPSAQDIKAQHHQEISTHRLGSDPEHLQESSSAAALSPPEERARGPSPPAPELSTDSEESDLQPDTSETDVDNERLDQVEEEEEEDEEEEEEEEEVEVEDQEEEEDEEMEEETKDETESGTTPGPEPVKEPITSELQEGMSTQQCEGGGAESMAGYLSTHKQTEGKLDVRGEDGEVQRKEGADATFYPGWYKQGVATGLEPMWCSTQAAEVKLEVSTQCGEGAVGDLQVQTPVGQDAHLLYESQGEIQEEVQHSPSGPGLLPDLQLQQHPLSMPPLHESQSENCGAGVIEEGKIPDLLCLSGNVDENLGDCSVDVSSSKSDSILSVIPEMTRSDMDEGNFKIRNGRREDPEVTEQPKKDNLGLNELKDLGLMERKCESEIITEGYICSDEEIAMTEHISKGENDRLDEDVDHSEESTDDTMIDDVSRLEFYCGSSALALPKEEESSKGPEDKTSIAESKDRVTSRISLQAVTLFFYLLAFLVILQRVWAYIGCFICT